MDLLCMEKEKLKLKNLSQLRIVFEAGPRAQWGNKKKPKSARFFSTNCPAQQSRVSG